MKINLEALFCVNKKISTHINVYFNFSFIF
jgi:hypothetical protein